MDTATTYIETEKRSAERSQSKLVPALRFKEFDGEWAIESFGKYVLHSAFGPRFSSDLYQKDGGIATLRTTDMDLDGNISYETMPFARITVAEVKDHILEQNDIVISRSGTIGITGIFKDFRAPVVPGAFLIRFRIDTKSVSSDFIKQNFNSPLGRHKLNALSAGGVQKNLTGTNVKKAEVNFPTLPEQQKIASFLSSIDKKIQQLSQKKALLEQYKKGVMQQLFRGLLRFKDDNGKDYPEWEEKRLGEVADRVTRKNKENNLNVLTISAQLGLISQLEYFNKSVSAKNVMNYYLLEKNEFAYNKSYSKGYPMGAIKRLKKYEKGVVSTLYICFGFRDTVSLSFMEQYFEFGRQNIELEKVAQEGARNHGLLNIGVNDFLNIDIKVPTLPEQQKIASYLSSIDNKIESVSNQISQTQSFKKGLLQQMFI